MVAATLGVGGCKDVSSFSTSPDESFCGNIVQGAFVRSGFSPAVQMRLRLDAKALQSQPGTLSTSDGLFVEAPLQVVPQLFHDPLSTLQFGEGRQRNLLYVAEPSGLGPAVTVVISLMEGGQVEVRLLRGAPPAQLTDLDGGTTPSVSEAEQKSSESANQPLFGVFPLVRRQGDCGF